MQTEGEILRLTSLIYESLDCDNAWKRALTGIQSALKAQSLALATFNFSEREGEFREAIGIENDYLKSYREHYSRTDVWMFNSQHYQQINTTQLSHNIVSLRNLTKSSFYTGWLKPQRLLHRLSAVLVNESGSICYLAALRAADHKAFGQRDATTCELLAPHLRTALRTRRLLGRLETERHAAFEVLDRLPIGVLLCNAQGNTVVANKTAQAIMASGDGLTCHRGRLFARNQRETDAIHRLIAHASQPVLGQEPGGTMTVSRPSGLSPLSVVISPLRITRDASDDKRVVAALFVSDPEQKVDAKEGLLSELYGLTRSESRLAGKIMQGYSVEEAATALNVSLETGRSYMKRVLSKTGVRRQAELVRLLLIGPAHLVWRTV